MKFNKKPLDYNFIKKWSKYGINQIILSILYRRNIVDDNDLIDFVNPIFENIIQPFEFPQIDLAYKRLSQALENNEKILVFGDRDVDGTTSVSILFSFLQKYTNNIFWEVPTGEDVYGLDRKKFANWRKNGYSLCITVDCGITNVNEIEELKTLGIDTIIIDHHKPLETVPNSISIVNPKCEKDFKFTDIAACGVVFIFIYGFLIYKSFIYNKKIIVVYEENNIIKVDSYINLIYQSQTVINSIFDIKNISKDLIYFYSDSLTIEDGIKLNNLFTKETIINQPEDKSKIVKLIFFNNILREIEDIEKIKEEYLPVVMFGLIADVMPIIKTNRIFVKLGLEHLRNNKNINLSTLFKKINIDISLCSSKDVAWNICPILNASGRIGCANVTVDFLTAKKDIETKVSLMLGNNEERKKKGEDAFNVFIEDLHSNKKYYDDNLTFFYSEKIARGITGITATKIANQVNCPVIVAAKEGEYYTGSMRGKSNVH
ncbi:MAG TPA: DHH family phosphoesterase, partial [Spirochaetota bacterium]|nr:DHH family phosphoesterase [Spirochaetota bacterium]